MAKKMYSFRSPRRRVVYTGEILDPKTGELVLLPSMTKQSFVKECDLNNIMKQFNPREQREIMSQQAQGGAYTDLPDPSDYQESIHVLQAASEAFAGLPALVRRRFDNDPAEFLEFLQDPANQDEAIKMGLAVDTRPPPDPTPAPAGPLKDPPADGASKS